MNAFRFKSLAAALLVALCALPASAVTVSWVTVGDPGNAADTTTYGAVGYEYQIMKFEWTNSQYVEFLNAVDPDGTNPNSIYDSEMGSDPRGGISFTSGSAAGTKYASRTNMGDKPVNFVSWFDAARVANWLQAGGTTYGNTASGSAAINSGAYTLSGATSGTAPAKNVGAQYWVPTENEWYKAAYYKGSGTNAGYWEYATQVTGTAPIGVGADVVGTGSSGVSPVISGNFANYDSEAVWNGQTGNVTTVGTNGGPSAYGAFDMTGNLFEWNDLDGNAGSSRGLRGGSWGNDAFNSSSSVRFTGSLSGDSGIGFRLASPVAVPKPSTWVMGLAGIACGGWQMYRRRRAR